MRPYLQATGHTLLLTGCSLLALGQYVGLAQAKVATPRLQIKHNSVLISSSTYDRTQGSVASLTIGATLAGSATATAKAVASNNYVTTWNNASVDGSYGVTAPIQLMDIEATTGAVLHTIPVPMRQVFTSFSSKSELGLHITQDGLDDHLVFVGYGGAGVGALDV